MGTKKRRNGWREKMDILISNDDGVFAEGIKSLKRTLSEIANVTVVAPLEERSTTGHTLTLDHPLRLVELEENVYGCSGYPADCALLGIIHLFKEKMNKKPDLLISGINRGPNLGQDTYYSGTVAAAREAVFHGIPSMAVSTASHFGTPKGDKLFYDTASHFVKKFLKEKIHEFLKPMGLLNINVPNLPLDQIKGVEMTRLGFQKYSEEIQKREDFRGRPYFWIGGIYEGFDGNDKTDCHAVSQGKVSVTPIDLLEKGNLDASKWGQLSEKILELS